MDKEVMKQIEAILFSCGRTIELEEISKLIGISSLSPIKTALKKISKEYEERESPLMIVDDSKGWKMTVREKYLVTVRKITPYMEFSKTLMETLAVVAWKQPIIQSDVIRIRTNKAYEHIMELEKMGFLAKEKHGRSYLLKLSQKFYDYFDLRNDVDVRNLFKNIKDTDDDEQKKVDEYDDKDKKNQTVDNVETNDKNIEENPFENTKEKNEEGSQETSEKIEDEIVVTKENESESINDDNEIQIEDEITHFVDSNEEKELKVEDIEEKEPKHTESEEIINEENHTTKED